MRTCLGESRGASLLRYVTLHIPADLPELASSRCIDDASPSRLPKLLFVVTIVDTVSFELVPQSTGL